jgi:PKD repeat protein
MLPRVMTDRRFTILVLVLLPACFVVVVDANGNQQNPFQNDSGSGGSQAVANCQVSPTNVSLGQAANFDGSNSQGSPGSSVVTWAWDFGDGMQAMGPQASHTYAAAGTYTASLTVTDSLGIQGVTQCSPVVVSQ